MRLFRKKGTTENYKEFRVVFSQIRKISTQATLQEVDMTAGYLAAVTEERTIAGRLTHLQREALLEMIEAKQQERREELEADEEPKDYGEPPLYKVGY